MAKYSIESNVFLGISHSGAVNVEGESYVELTDEEVQILVNLIKEEETTDVEELGLEDSHPALYEKLREAYYKMTCDAEELHWLWEGYNNGYYEYDPDELKEYCKQHCGFVFEESKEDYTDEDGNFDEDAYEEAETDAFDLWLDDYVNSLSDDEAKSFFYNHMDADLDMEDIDYEVEIPEAIIEMAER